MYVMHVKGVVFSTSCLLPLPSRSHYLVRYLVVQWRSKGEEGLGVHVAQGAEFLSEFFGWKGEGGGGRKSFDCPGCCLTLLRHCCRCLLA